VDRQAIKTPSNTARPLFQKRREERITTEHEESVRQQILDGSMIGVNNASIQVSFVLPESYLHFRRVSKNARMRPTRPPASDAGTDRDSRRDSLPSSVRDIDWN
jgi:hypothetical protein